MARHRRGQPLLHRIRHADHAIPAGGDADHSSVRARRLVHLRGVAAATLPRHTRPSGQHAGSGAQARDRYGRQPPGAPGSARRVPAIRRFPQQPHDRASLALDRRLLGIVRFFGKQGAAELLPFPAWAAKRVRRLFHRFRLRARRRRDHLQPAERPAGLLPDRRARKPHRQGADQYRAGPGEARPGCDQRHLLHELPRQGHAAEGGSGPRLCAEQHRAAEGCARRHRGDFPGQGRLFRCCRSRTWNASSRP